MFVIAVTGKQWVYCGIRVDSCCSFSVIIFFPYNTMVSSSTILIKVKSGSFQNSMH